MKKAYYLIDSHPNCPFARSPANFSRTNPPFFDKKPLIHGFLNKTVIVEIDNGNIRISGRLVRYDLGSKNPHRPCILILENQGSYLIVRGVWLSVGVPK